MRIKHELTTIGASDVTTSAERREQNITFGCVTAFVVARLGSGIV
jgi:hypothetical protein